MTTTELALLSPESETRFRQCFIEDPTTGAIRVTRTGYAEYGSVFARAGIDINKIRTREELRCACRASEWVVFEELRELAKGHKAIEAALAPLWS